MKDASAEYEATEQVPSRLEFHPIAAMFPLLEGAEFESLVNSIAQSGLQEPITLFDGKILDGRNRYRACFKARVEPRFRTIGEHVNPWSFVWAENAERRHIDKGQRAAIWLKLRVGAEEWDIERAEAKQRANEARSRAMIGNDNASKLKEGKHGERSPQLVADTVSRARAARESETRARVAKSVGVSHATAQDAMTLQKKAPVLFDKVAAGEITLYKAARALKHDEARARVAAQAASAPERAVIRHLDAGELLASLPSRSVDLLLTDPPYMTDVDDNIGEFAAAWVHRALSCVKDTGRAYICTGAYPEELGAYLSALRNEPRLTLANVLVWTYRNTIGPSPKLDYKLNWQAIFYLRGPKAPDLDCPILTEQFSVQDVNAPDGRQGDRYHAWQKPDELAERMIRHSTRAGDLVVDPFAGTGTFLLAAARLGRRALGCEINEATMAIALERGCVREN